MTSPCAKKKHETCPIAAVAALVGDMWILLILRDLSQGTKRFGELLASLDGVSTRTLTLRLKFLEQQDLIRRTVQKTKPPRVDYTLTKKGEKLSIIISAMRTYGEKYL